MLSYAFALPATHCTCSVAHWHAHMQNIAYWQRSSAAAPAQAVLKNTQTGRGIFKCTDNLYGTQYNVVQLGGIKKFLLCIFNRKSSSATDSCIVVGYANKKTLPIIVNSRTLSNSRVFMWAKVHQKQETDQVMFSPVQLH